MSHIKDRLKQYKDEYSKYSKHDGLYIEDVLEILEQLQSDLEQDEKENGWILVGDKEEKMPEERNSMFAKFKGTNKWKEAMFEKISNDVLVTILYRNSLFVQQAHTVDGKWKNDLLALGGTTIAWKPLPEPYKEGAEHETD